MYALGHRPALTLARFNSGSLRSLVVRLYHVFYHMQTRWRKLGENLFLTKLLTNVKIIKSEQNVYVYAAILVLCWLV